MKRGFFIFAVCLLQLFSFSQKKEKPIQIVIRNTTILDVVNKDVFKNKTIGIDSGKIIYIQDGGHKYNAKRIIDGTNLIAMPGFINTHTHLWQHISKSTRPKEKLQQWVAIYNPIHYLTDDELYKVVLAASSEAIISGITTVSDYSSLNFNDYSFEANAKAMYDAGLGGVIVWHNPSVFLPDIIKEEEIQRYQNALKGKFSIWMGHGPLSFHSLPQVYSGIRLAKRLNMSMTEHTMENVQEQRDLFDSFTKYYTEFKGRLKQEDKSVIESMLSMTRPSNVDAYERILKDANQVLQIDSLQNKLTSQHKLLLSNLRIDRTISPLVILEHLGVLQNYLAIHSVWQQQEDIGIMNKFNVSISHNPESNLYLSSGIAPVNDYLKSGINVTIGTDGAASNDGIDFFSAMKEMWNDFKFDLLNADTSKSFDEWNILQAATINGAKALKIDDVTGSISVGKEADIVLLSREKLGLAPLRTGKIVPLIIYSAGTRNVVYVISNGNIVLDSGSLTRYKESNLANDLSTIAAKVDQRVDDGKVWNQYYAIKSSSPYWYKYRSIRPLDSVSLVIENTSNMDLKLSLASSSLRFGGGISYVADSEVNDRFPQNNPEQSFYETFDLKPKQKVGIIKKRKVLEIQIIEADRSRSYTIRSGQIMILAEKKN